MEKVNDFQYNIMCMIWIELFASDSLGKGNRHSDMVKWRHWPEKKAGNTGSQGARNGRQAGKGTGKVGGMHYSSSGAQLRPVGSLSQW